MKSLKGIEKLNLTATSLFHLYLWND